MNDSQRTLVPLDSVVISDRIREDVGDIEELAISLLRHGLLQPIILDSDNNLLAGFRRYSAATLNGWTEIWAVHQAEGLSDIQRLDIELEENLRRKQMTPAEEIKGIAAIDEIKRKLDPSWGQQQTAIATGMQRSAVSTAIKLSKMIDLFPELKDAKSVRQLKSWAEHKAASISRVIEVRDNQETFAEVESKIILGDCVSLIKTIPDESFDHIITDPPFGIDADARRSSTIGSVSSYEDSEDSYERLLSMAPDLYRVLRPNGWLVWFLGISWYERAKNVFRESGFTVDEIPIVWDRSEGRCHTNRPDKYFARAYDLALHCSKGEPQLLQRNRPNIIRAKPVDNAETLFERPIELYAELIKRLTIPGETVADFFVGSGSCPAAAVSLGRNYFGVERDPERRAYAIKKIKSYTPER